MQRTVFFLLWFVAIVSCLFASFHWGTLDHYTLVRWAAYLMPWLLALIVLSLTLAICCRFHWTLVFFLLLPIFYISYCLLPEILPKKIIKLSGSSLKVMTFNVWSENNQAERTYRVIDDNKPDILLLQEIEEGHMRSLLRALEKKSDGRPYYFRYDPKKMLATISKYPIKPLVVNDTSRAKIQKVHVAFGSKPITIYNVHLLRGSAHKKREVIEKFILGSQISEQGPIIVAGDFNVTSQTLSYQTLKRNLQNSHDAAGRGFAFTFPSGVSILPPSLNFPGLVRIDHVFYSRHFNANLSQTLYCSTGSDHYPVLVDLTLIQ